MNGNGVHCVSLPAPSLSHLMYAMEVSPAGRRRGGLWTVLWTVGPVLMTVETVLVVVVTVETTLMVVVTGGMSWL